VQAVSFAPTNIAEWLRLAWNGAAVRYTGTVRMSFNDVAVRLERRHMAGIFGIDQASSIFEFQDVRRLPQLRPSVVPVSFALRTGSSRTAVLLVFLALLGAMAASAVMVMSRRQAFEIAISRGPATTIALRRLGTHQIVFEQKVLGRLARDLIGGYGFHPARGDAAVTVQPATQDDTWDVRFASGSSHQLSIRAKGGGTSKPRKTAAPPVRGAPAPPSGGRVPPPPPPRPRR
jgi:hypothetical protein